MATFNVSATAGWEKKPKSKEVSLSRHVLHLKPTRYMKEILSVAN